MRSRASLLLLLLCFVLSACDSFYEVVVTNVGDQPVGARLYEGARFRNEIPTINGTPYPIHRTTLAPGESAHLHASGGGAQKAVVDAWSRSDQLLFCTVVDHPHLFPGPQTPTPVPPQVQITPGHVDCPGASQ